MIGVIGDIHIRNELAYADYFPDRRNGEREAVFNKIIESFSDCDKIVLLGDSLNSKNNDSESIKIFVDFIKRLQVGGKKIYVLAGNHELFASGRSAVDFLEKLNDKSIQTVIRSVYEESGMVFSPYFYPSQQGTNSYEEATQKVMSQLPDGNILFAHQAIADTKTQSGQMTDLFHEIILDREALEKKYKLIFGGHIHNPQRIGNTIITGSVFTQEVNETEKFVWKIDELNYEVEKIKLPCRAIVKEENPNAEDISSIPQYSIYKAVFTKKLSEEEMEKRLVELRKKDAYIVVEQYEQERKKVSHNKDVLDLSMPELLKLYAEENKIDFGLLIRAYELIK